MMFRIIARWIWVVAGVLAICHPEMARAQQKFDLQKFKDSEDKKALIHVTVNGETKDGKFPPNPHEGTAFFISDDYALTAAHLFFLKKDIAIKEDRLVQARVTSGAKFIQGRIGSVGLDGQEFDLVEVDEIRDTALIQVKDRVGKNKIFTVCGDLPNQEDFYALGWVARLFVHPSGKLDSGLNVDRFVTSVALNPGMSGAPVVGPSGRVFAMATGGVRKPGFEQFNYMRPVQFWGKAFEVSGVKPDCSSGSSIIGSISVPGNKDNRFTDPGPSTDTTIPAIPSVPKETIRDNLMVYVSFLGGGQDERLQTYRRALHQEIFRLARRSELELLFEEEPQEDPIVKEIFKEYFEGSREQQKIQSFLTSFWKRGAINQRSKLYIYLLRLESRGSRIEAGPRLIEARWENDAVTTLSTQSLITFGEDLTDHRDKVRLEAAARAHVVRLLQDAAATRYPKAFARPAVFLDCITPGFVVARPLQWTRWSDDALTALYSALDTEWGTPEKPPLLKLYRKLLKTARADFCSLQRPPDDPNDDDRYMHSMAREIITPIVVKNQTDESYQFDWWRHQIGHDKRRHGPKGPALLSLDDYTPFVKGWSMEITETLKRDGE